MKRLFLILSLAFISTFVSLMQAGHAQEAKPRHAPNALPGVEPAMLTADYWIALYPDADEVIMTPEEIRRFNAIVRSRANVEEGFEGPSRKPLLPLSMPRTMPGDSLRFILSHNRDKLFNPDALYGSEDYYDGRNAIYSDVMKQEIADRMNLDAVPGVVRRRYGIVVNHAMVRQYPTDVPGYHNTTTALDRFQVTDLCIGNPVAILHESTDGDYLYVECPLARGWIAARDIAVGSLADIRGIVGSEPFLMAAGNKVPVYGDPGCKRFARHFYFSARLPLVRRAGHAYVVSMPYREEDGSLGITNGYVKPDADVHVGFPPYTTRNVLTQIFKLLNTPYGWHGQDNKRDCVGVQRVLFRCFGIETGRFIRDASDNKVLVDSKLSVDEKIAIARKVTPVITVASAPGHVVLFLGEGGNGKLYFMHQGGWGYKDENGDHLIVNRVSINEVTHSWYNIKTPNCYTIMAFK